MTQSSFTNTPSANADTPFDKRGIEGRENITKHIGSVSIATAISRVLGYLRDMFVAYAFGAGALADAFYAAYRIPNLFRRLFGEGSVSTAFVPVFSEYFEKKTRQETAGLLNAVFTALFLILLTLTLLGIIFAAPITKIIAWGFSSDTYKLTATIELTRILFPYLLFACLAALMLGVLNSMKVFFLPAVAPALLSVSEIIYVTLFIFVFTLNEDVQIKGLALSVLAGGFGQYVLQQIAVIKNGMPLRFSTDFRHPGLKNIFYLMLPSMIGFSVDQVNSFVDTICASFISEGSITALYYSNRLMQLPLALFGIATATVSLPHMAESIVQNNLSEMKNTLNFSIRMVIFSLVPATVGLAMLAEPIVRVLFERGSFDKTATAFTSSALIFYCWGLVAFSTTKIIAAAFYSMKNTKIPVRTAVISMLVNVILNVILMKPMGVGGLALATTISSWLNTTILLVSLRNKIGLLGIRKIINSSIKILISTGVMAAGVHFTHITLSVYNETISVFMSIIIGIFLYFFASRHLKSEELKPIISMLRRESPSDE